MSKKKFNSNLSRGLSQVERFWQKVDIKGDDDCWEWQAGTDKKGYGLFIFDGHTVHTNRLAWKLYFGDVPDGLLVCHTCDNPPCVNPNHLFLGTNTDNMQDMFKKGRAKVHRMYGTNNPNAKLSDNQVDHIKNLYNSGQYTYKQLGNMFGIAFQTVGQIVQGERRNASSLS